MLSERELEAIQAVFDARTQSLTDEYLRRMGEHLNTIGHMKASDVNRLLEMKRMGANIDAMKRRIAEEINGSTRDVEKVFAAIATDDYRFAQAYYGSARSVPIRQNAPLKRILQAQAKITTQALHNLSNTTVLSDAYRKALDTGIQAVQSGLTDYNAAIRQSVRNAAVEGLRVKYASGHTRRLDSAVRMNTLDGARQLNMDVMYQVGKEFGADGVEISAHALCAEDHLDIQGEQMSYEDFDKLQATLEREIGTWNCRHFATPIKLGISKPSYTQDDLTRYKANSRAQIEIDGVTRSRYDWSQEMRKIETAVRYQKDIANAAKSTGDDILRRNAQSTINYLVNNYNKITEGAGLSDQSKRMSVSAFRRVKTINELKKKTV